IESSHQARRSSDTEIRTSGAIVGNMELVTMLARSRERASLPVSHGAVLAVSGVMGHTGGPTSTTGSHHHAVGSRERGKRALASPSTPAAAEGTTLVLADISTNLTDRTLVGHYRAWDKVGFDSVTRTELLPSSAETRHPAAGSSVTAAEDPRSGIHRAVPGSMAQPLASAPFLVALTWGRFPGPSTEHQLTPRPASESTAAAVGSSYQPSRVSAMERRVSDFPTTSNSVSTTATKAFRSNFEPKSIPAAEEEMLHLDVHGADMPSVAVGAAGSPPNGHSAGVTRGSATNTDPTSSLEVTFSSLGAKTHRPNNSQETTKEPLLTSSLSTSKSTFRAVGSSHRSLSSSTAKERMFDPITDPAHHSFTSAGDGERTLHSVTDKALSSVMESFASYAETSSSPGPAEPASVEQSGTPNVSTSSGGFAAFATETLFAHSSKIPTTSFQNDLTSFSSTHQRVSSVDAEKRTSVSHTDGTYISTTYTRGGERTLLSISNSSTSADSSESSTSFSEISNPYDSLKSSVAQDRTSNVSSDGSFVEPSTEPLLVHSSKLLPSASAGSVQNTTLFNSDSELLTTGRSSVSSSAFPASSSSNDSDQASTSAATTVVRRVPSTATVAASLPRSTNKHNVTHRPQRSTTFTSTTSPLPTAPMEQLGGHIVSMSMSAPVTVTETASPRAATVQQGSFEKATPLLTTANVDKCLSNPCPALATCNSTRGSYTCQCPLGYELEKGKCNLVRIFIGQVPLKLNITHGKYTELLHIEGEILAMLDASLSGLPGYHRSAVKATREANFVHVSVQSTFSLASNVTFYDIVSSVKSYIRACKSPTDTCQFISSLKPLHRVGSLCKQKDPECDKETSECTDFDGVALCQCKSGYFKYNKMDHSCRACEDGYKLENETCVSCPFGLGGFNCGNPYQLITVVIAAAGGGLLLIMGIALIVTCCRKNKNDISKLIFKSGDFQMSPYAEYPKNPRAQEWGRETIEMQENGSTKNLLQMTDVYYSPTGLRNPELERNGLYPPYTGLPGSRHSCIYPGQYNPSFISDETRRRDYF
ncbi:PREDICTED: protein HEG homolog 1, partial [Mesitornis unicolor]|uniref:protein HEG homolog 1 n=1 Tax=Mesitornis unicolor TaxID=54374 RepID=UPI000528E437